MFQYFCEACGFKFARNKENLNKTCPYCSKDKVRQMNLNLIKEIK
jgi:predicted Zn-ribbon and HTH transcriptional regulator